MATKKGRSYLTKNDLDSYSLWIAREEDDLIYPVYGPDDFPEYMSMYDLKVRANFLTKNDIELKGYIVGLKNIYCIVIFIEKEIFYLNKNLYNDCIQDLKRMNALLGVQLNPNEYFPIQYETTMNIEGFNNFCGEFDIFKPMTNEERLENLQ